jgi:hypothetical protein
VIVLEVAEHGKSFAWSGLSVGEDGGILTFEEAVDMPSAYSVKYLTLFWIFIEDIVVAVLVLAIVNHVLVKADARLIQWRSEAAVHFYLTALIFFTML